MTVEVCLTLEGMAGCCGVTQIMKFSSHSEEEEYDSWGSNLRAEGRTVASAYRKLFRALRKCNLCNSGYGQVLQIWFVKERDFEDKYANEFRAEPFRKLVAGTKGVIDLGEYVNPNSGNIIHGYQWEQKQR